MQNPLWFQSLEKRKEERTGEINLTAALASAALAFLSRALEASRSKRRFSKSLRSLCEEDDIFQYISIMLKSVSTRESVKLTEMVLQSPSRKLRRGVRKLMDEVCRNSLSAPPSLLWQSPTLIRVLPTVTNKTHSVGRITSSSQKTFDFQHR